MAWFLVCCTGKKMRILNLLGFNSQIHKYIHSSYALLQSRSLTWILYRYYFASSSLIENFISWTSWLIYHVYDWLTHNTFTSIQNQATEQICLLIILHILKDSLVFEWEVRWPGNNFAPTQLDFYSIMSRHTF